MTRHKVRVSKRPCRESELAAAQARADAARDRAKQKARQRKRAARPGQRAPQRARPGLDDSNQDNDYRAAHGSGDDGAYAEDISHEERKERAAEREQVRILRSDLAWRARRNHDAEAARGAAMRLPGKRDREEAALQVEMQARIAAAHQSHGCIASWEGDEAVAELQPVSDRRVTIMSLTTSAAVTVPTTRCSFCGDLVEVTACDVHCFPHQPVVDSVWVDRSVLDLAQHLIIKSGCSMNGVYDALCDVLGQQNAATVALPIDERCACQLA